MALDVTGFAQAAAEGGHHGCPRAGRLPVEKPDHRHHRLLRACRERPRDCRAADEREELAPPDLWAHSITSSARAMSVGGTSRPSALAVARFMIRRLSTWLLCSWTGFLIHLLLMKSGNAENGGSLKGRKNFEICATLSAS